MERKTIIDAPEGKPYLTITREFDLPLDLLFRAYAEAAIVEQWMGTKVKEMENRQHGGYRFETCDDKGNIVFSTHGTIHDFVADEKIVRTFEMDNVPFDVHLEFLDFTPLGEDRSRLTIQMIYRSEAHREAQLKLPFAYGINMAHDRLQEVLNPLK